jgi:SAM-dependent methyltransferase
MSGGKEVRVSERPFRDHPNRRPHNWAFYDAGEKFLITQTQKFNGVLYDLGCGEMPYREWLLQYVDTYVGVDWSNTLHDFKADITADLNEQMPIEDEVADTVLSLSVMEHLREPHHFLAEAHRILKTGGVFILQVPFMWGVHEAPYDYYRYTCYGLEHMFSKAGFRDVVVTPQTGFWLMWTLKFNYQTTRLVRGPWLMRIVIAAALRVIWAVDQRLALELDRRRVDPNETAGYFVTARK